MASSSLTSSPSAETQLAQCNSGINVANFVSSKLCRDKNGNNYKSWKEQMLCLVESQGLLGSIDGKAPPIQPPIDDVDHVAWRRTDRLVKGWILGALSDEVLRNVVHLDSARDVWLDLETKLSNSKAVVRPPATQQGKGWHEYSALYRAAMSGDWDTARVILELDPTAISARVAFTLETALHVAVGSCKSTSFVEKLVELSDDDSLSIKDQLGFNPLHVAALTGNIEAARILVRRLPDLLYALSNRDRFPLHLAADACHRQTIEFLISHTRDDLPTNPFAAQSGLLLLNFLIDADFFDMAFDLVEKYPYLARLRHPETTSALKRMAVKVTTFVPQLNFWERFVRLLPCVKRIHEKKLMHEQALRLVKCICEHMKSLNYEEASAIYVEAVLIAARLGNHEVIEEIVATFPASIYCVDAAAKQNFLHLAVRNRCEKVFNLIYQTTNHRYHYLNRIDTSGNSILHLAATLAPPHKLNLVSGAALQMQRELQWFKEADKFISPYLRGRANHAGKTAEMIFTEQHRDLKVEGEKWMKDTANSCTIAAALIATVVFAAAITVPGGNESETGYPMMWKNSAFTIFAVSDAVSLFTSATSLLMFLSILTSRYAEEDFLYALPKRLCIGLVTLFLSILFMMFAFSSTLYLVFGRKKAWVLIPVAVLTCLPISSFVLLQSPLLIVVISSTYGRGIFGKQSHRPFH